MGSSELMSRIKEIVSTKDIEYDLEPYDLEKHGALVDDQIPDGYTEIDRYWVDEPYAFVLVLYDTAKKVPVYTVVEPSLTPFEKTLLIRLYEDLSDVLTLDDVEFADANAKQFDEGIAEEILDGNGGNGGTVATEGVEQSEEPDEKLVDMWFVDASAEEDGTEFDIDLAKSQILQRKALELLGYYSIELSPRSTHKILHFLNRNYVGYGKLDAVLKDPHIEDISCDGVDIPIFLYHTVYKNIETNLTFNEDYLNSFVIQLVQRGGKHISIGSPMVDATLPDGSRLQATLGKEITTRGSSFTIRRFKEDPFTPVDMLNFGTCSSEMLAYFWLAIENNKSMILAGGTASGKTSALNAISMFIPPIAKVVSIEDTRELTLHHENWIAGVTRESTIAQEGVSDINMFELLKAALRQRPEYILVGEVRGEEALTLFQAMSTGHTTYSTMHAADIETLLNRLQGEPINVPHAMLQALNIVSIQMQTYIGNERVRRTKTLLEITGLDQRTDQ